MRALEFITGHVIYNPAYTNSNWKPPQWTSFWKKGVLINLFGLERQAQHLVVVHLDFQTGEAISNFNQNSNRNSPRSLKEFSCHFQMTPLSEKLCPSTGHKNFGAGPNVFCIINAFNLFAFCVGRFFLNRTKCKCICGINQTIWTSPKHFETCFVLLKQVPKYFGLDSHIVPVQNFLCQTFLPLNSNTVCYGHSQSEKKSGLRDKYQRSIKAHTYLGGLKSA